MDKISQKKKLEILFAFQNFVIFLKQQYKIQVYILYTDFVKSNSKLAVNYFAKKKIIWKLSIPNTQQQKKLIKNLMQIIIKRVKTQIIDSSLSLKL